MRHDVRHLLEASEDEHLLRTHEVAAAVIFDWLSLVHWQAVSVIPQVVADVIALWIQGCWKVCQYYLCNICRRLTAQDGISAAV